jgi:hypothetical protein
VKRDGAIAQDASLPRGLTADFSISIRLLRCSDFQAYELVRQACRGCG